MPGAYSKQRPDAFMMAMQYIEELEKRRPKSKDAEMIKMAPAICFSRKIGGGALEIADILSGKIKLPVVDREILEHIAQNLKLSKKTIEFFDERYPGKMAELGAMFLSEKSFIMSDYIRNFVSAVFTFADRGSTIFVGRGTHLVLPRDRVLAVRVVCSDELRIKRLATIQGIEETEAKKILGQIDKEQRDFFKKAFGKKDASPYEFDLIVNCDYLSEPQGVAKIVAQAFIQKFAFESTVK